MRHALLSLLLLLTTAVHAADETRHISIEGYLNPDSIHFRLDLEEDKYEGFIAGETTYFRKKGKTATIKVWGRGSETEVEGQKVRTIVLSEFNGTKICGMFVLILNSDKTFREGCWTLDGKVREMFDVKNIASTQNKKFLVPVDITSATGVYEFSADSGNPTMPEYGGTLQLYVDGRNIAYSACQVTPNIADTHGKMSESWGNQFYFYAGSIYYLVYTYKGAAFVVRNRWTDNGEQNEEFGHNADIVGIYIATGEKPSGVVLEAFDEEKEFSQNHLPCSVFQLNDAWIESLGGETTYPDEVITKDIDGDGIKEIICRYTPDRTEGYEVSGKRSAIFAYENGTLMLVAKSDEDLEYLSIADQYVIKSSTNSRGSRTTHRFYYLFCGKISEKATMSDADIDSYTVDGKTVSEKEFKKQIKIKNRIKIDDLDGWLEIPGNVFRNEHAARG